MVTTLLSKLTECEHLSHTEASDLMHSLLSGDLSDVEIAAILTALRTKGETVEELCGLLEAMREKMLPVECQEARAVDLCGTGGDHSGSFNLSTAAALVAAAGGVTVAKHGNRAVTSQSGSADFLEALKIPFPESPVAASAQLAKHKFVFLFAPHYHPSMKIVATVRKQLRIRTVFNILGPLANPARVKRQLVGVYSPAWLDPIAETLATTGTTHALVIHGSGGLDEMCADGNTYGVELCNGEKKSITMSPDTIGVKATSRAAIIGGNATENAKRFLAVANGEESELTEWIIANSAPAFYLAEQCKTLREGSDHARETIASGKLKSLLHNLSC